jgi:ABC-type transport system substrate-binding protein
MDQDPYIIDPPGLMRYVVEVLNDLGLRADLKIVQDDPYVNAVYQETARAGSPGHPQVYLSGWISIYPSAADFIEPQFSCGGFGNPSGWCSERLDARMEEALRLYATDPGASTRAWTEIEHQLVDDAIFAPLTNPVFTNVVSSRTGNVQIHPQWGILHSRLWVQ